VALHDTVGLRDQDAGNDTLLVNVESTAPGMNDLHESTPLLHRMRPWRSAENNAIFPLVLIP
jgi:hypothetical protein